MNTTTNESPSVKFEPHFLEGDKVAFKSKLNSKYMSCNGYNLYVNGPRIDAWEYFYVYTTGERNQYIALKSRRSGGFVTHVSDSKVQCNA